MRPVRLEVTGFSAFRETAEISFEGADLVAFVGATGSGKSSLIDAMTFALYGCVARYDDLRVVEPAIHQLATEARVRLDFELDGRRYTAVRVVRRTKTGATTKEARLARTDADGSETTLAGNAKELTAAVTGLLGLDFEQFTRTVVLPQGDFALFLHADKAKRQELLRQLLDVAVYEGMGREARRRRDTGAARCDLLREQLAAQDEVTPDRLAELEARIEALATLEVDVSTRLSAIAELDVALTAAAAEVRSLEGVEAALAAITVPDAVTVLAPQIAAAEAAATAAAASLTEARTARDTAKAAVDAAPDLLGLQRALDAIGDTERLAGEIAQLEPTERAAADASGEAARAAEVAAAAFEAADGRLQAAKDAAGLSAVIAGLVVGEPCPVCEQVVGALPDHDVDADLARAIEAHAEAKAARTSADEAAGVARKVHDRLAAELKSLRADHVRAAAAVPAEADGVALAAQLAEARARKEAFDAALAAVKEAEAADAEAQHVLAGHRAGEDALRRDLVAARDSVSARTPPSPSGSSLEADWAALSSWAADQLTVVRAELDTARAAATELATRRTEVVDSVDAACTAAGLSGPSARALERIAAESASARHALDGATQLAADQAQLTTDIAELEVTVGLNQEMGELLSARGFERWLLQSALDDLVARATDRLFELSGGQFSLESTDGDFAIRDHRNADERRGVRTLSGGETFLASLALALALAESIAELAVEGGPRIESMFLDEGFGTLDPDTLDVVATTIEELSASGRLIGIVTHIHDLADRMPVRFEVHKDATSARVERVEV